MLWPEVSVALDEGRHELVLSGSTYSERVAEGGLDQRLFQLTQLNFLEISRCGLSQLSDEIQKCKELTKLSLQHNILSTIPNGLGLVCKLRFLDLSFNKLSALPDNIFYNMNSLETLTLDSNQLIELPSLKGLVELHRISISNNRLKIFPETVRLCSKLMAIDAAGNALTSLSVELKQLSNLQRLNVCDNMLTEVPCQLSECKKLREFLIERNPLKDNRLRKLASDPHSGPALVNYLAKIKKTLPKDETTSTSTPNQVAPGKVHLNLKPSNILPDNLNFLEIDREANCQVYSVRIIDPQSVRNSLRPRIFACSVAGVSFKDELVLKEFLRFQIKLHGDLGQQRRVATMSTHDEAFLSLPLTYSVSPVDSIYIHALNMKKPQTARSLLLRLQLEAELERKRRKMTEFSGVQKYLQLISSGFGPGQSNVVLAHIDLPPLPITVDAEHKTLSLHPVTSCHQTRLSANTTVVLLEVAGREGEVCKKIMRALISWLLQFATGTNSSTTGDGDNENKRLILRPLTIVDAVTGDKFAQYPTPNDILKPDFLTDVK